MWVFAGLRHGHGFFVKIMSRFSLIYWSSGRESLDWVLGFC